MAPRRTPAVNLEQLVLQLARSLEETRAEVAQLVRNSAPRDAEVVPPPPPPPPRVQEAIAPPPGKAIIEFQKLKPPTFTGNADHVAIHDWFNEVEKIFDALRTVEEDKVLLGAHQLTGDAYIWWQREATTFEGEAITWANFKERMKAKFLPKTERDRLFQAFLHIKQGNRTVTEYEREFSRLAQYAPSLIATEEDKISHFENGLKFGIRGLTQSYNSQTFVLSLNAALKVEKHEEERMATYDRKKKRGQPQQGGKGKKLAIVAATQGPPATTPVQRKVVCYKCQKEGHKANVCRSKKCYTCGKFGHMSNQCKQGGAPQTAQPLAMRPPLPPLVAAQSKGKELIAYKGKVYALTEEEATIAPGVITGISYPL